MTESECTAEFVNGDQRSFEYRPSPLDVGEDARTIVASPRESTERKRRGRERERFSSVVNFSRWKLTYS